MINLSSSQILEDESEVIMSSQEEFKETDKKVVIPQLNLGTGQSKALTKRSVNNSTYFTNEPKNIIDDFSSYLGNSDVNKNSYNTCKSSK